MYITIKYTYQICFSYESHILDSTVSVKEVFAGKSADKSPLSEHGILQIPAV